MTAGAIDINVRSGQREVGGIVVKVVGRYPGRFGVAPGTIGRELQGGVIRIGGVTVVLRMAAETGIRCVIVVSIVTSGTVIGDGRMGAIQGVVIIVIGEGSGHPIGFGSMAAGTIGSEA